MNPIPLQFEWTRHARRRWRERAQPNESALLAIYGARLAGNRVMKRIRKHCPAHVALCRNSGPWRGHHYLTNQGWVFVMNGRKVVTCFRLPISETTRK